MKLWQFLLFYVLIFWTQALSLHPIAVLWLAPIFRLSQIFPTFQNAVNGEPRRETPLEISAEKADRFFPVSFFPLVLKSIQFDSLIHTLTKEEKLLLLHNWKWLEKCKVAHYSKGFAELIVLQVRTFYTHRLPNFENSLKQILLWNTKISQYISVNTVNIETAD